MASHDRPTSHQYNNQAYDPSHDRNEPNPYKRETRNPYERKNPNPYQRNTTNPYVNKSSRPASASSVNNSSNPYDAGRYGMGRQRPISSVSGASNTSRTSNLRHDPHVTHGSPASHPSYSSRGSGLNSEVMLFGGGWWIQSWNKLGTGWDYQTFPSKFEETQEDINLKKKVGLVSGVALIAGTMIGSGIFISPTGVAANAGSVGATMVLWTLGGVISMLGALSYAELGTFICKSGAEYSYLLSGFGPMGERIGALPAFLFSWVHMVLLKPAAVSIITLTFAIYVLEPFYTVCEQPTTSAKCLAALVILIITIINCLSVRASILLQNILTVTKLLAIAIIIIGGIVKLAQGRTEQLSNGFSDPSPEAKSPSAGEIAIAIYTSMWAYDGWNNLNYVTEEIIDPEKNLKWAIIIAIPLVTLCYVFVNISYFSVMTLGEIAESSAVAVTWGNRVLGVMWWLVPLFVACSTFGAANGTLFSAGRLPYVAAREGHMVEVAGMVHVKYLTPLPAIVFTAIMAMLFIIPGDIFSLIDFFSFAVWFFYCITFIALVVMRFWGPEKNAYRPFKVFIPIPILMALIAFFLVFVPIVTEPRIGFFLALLFIIAGVAFYVPFVVFADRIHPKLEFIMAPVTSFLQCLMEVSLPTEETVANLHESTI